VLAYALVLGSIIAVGFFAPLVGAAAALACGAAASLHSLVALARSGFAPGLLRRLRRG
jgi:hypothetical protein